MGETQRVVVTGGSQFIKEYFDKNAAADYLSAKLGREISPSSMRMYHHRNKCIASSRYEDGRLRWTRADLDRYVWLEVQRQSLKTSGNLAYRAI